MLGKNRGVVALFEDMIDHFIGIHAAGHVCQLSVGDATASVEYVGDFTRIVQQTYTEYSNSGKKRFNLQAIADGLGAQLLKQNSIHGIRWVASQHQTLFALLQDLPVVILDLNQRAKEACGITKGMLTSSVCFLGLKFTHRMEKADGSSSSFLATVETVVTSPSGERHDSFVLRYRDKTSLTVTKAELVAILDSGAHDRLEGPLWELHEELLSFRFVLFLHFMLDYHAVLKILSKCFQSNTLLISDITDDVSSSLRSLRKLKRNNFTTGAFVKQFHDNFDSDSGKLACLLKNSKAPQQSETAVPEEKTISLILLGQEQRNDVERDMEALLDETANSLTERYLDVLKHPILQTFAVFEHRHWPQQCTDDTDEFAQTYGHAEIDKLLEFYGEFFSDTEKLVARQQWVHMKEFVRSKPVLFKLPYSALYLRLAVHFREKFAVILRLPLISFLLASDTSECERIFSLMNDLKSANRSNLGSEKLKYLMMWKRVFGQQEIRNFDPFEIVRMWHTISKKTRNQTRPETV
eukprot:Lithocolla_globosa_v1_NODE_316_length_4526_cov_4.454403.p2 type:complete len:523 gc:universal NODE_316_length_4526_cov_4.454403:2787-4355(+)